MQHPFALGKIGGAVQADFDDAFEGVLGDGEDFRAEQVLSQKHAEIGRDGSGLLFRQRQTDAGV